MRSSAGRASSATCSTSGSRRPLRPPRPDTKEKKPVRNADVDVDVSYLASSSWDAHMPERFRWLREHDPVRWSETDQVWLVTRYADVAYVSKHQELFTSSEGVRPGYGVKIGLIDEAEPRHGELRALINRGFTPRMVKQLEQVFRRLTTRAIDSIAGSPECDFVASVSVPLPLWLIAAMIGIREE